MQGGETIIGLNLGTRYVGIAVLKGTELRDWRIRSLRGRTLVEKFQRLTAILGRLVDRYEPTAVALKKPHPSRSSTGLNQIQAEAKAFLEQNGVTVNEYTIDDLKGLLLPGGQANRSSLAEYVTTAYPILTSEYSQEKKARHAYHVRVFEALAAAVARTRH